MGNEEINIPFRSYCWALGTTSFRTRNFNIVIEQQLAFLSEFRNRPEYKELSWDGDLQTAYYYFLRENGFVAGDAPRPAKDAREKTSGLVDIGLADGERRLTQVGERLLEISSKGDFSSDNPLELPKDSFIYLKQLLKTSNKVDGEIVRPFIILAYLEAELGYLTFDEFRYFLPLCTNEENTKNMVGKIWAYRRGELAADDILIGKLFSMENYCSAYSYLMENEVTEDVIRIVGMNRKSRDPSGENYDQAYYPVYCLIRRLTFDSLTAENRDKLAIQLFEAVKQVKNSPSGMWKQYLFKTVNTKAVMRDGALALKASAIFTAENEADLKTIFFKQLHLFKMKANLNDYFDLNRRYFRTTDTLIFADERVEFDIMPKVYFSGCGEELLSFGFLGEKRLGEDISLEEIAPCLKIDEDRLYGALGLQVGRVVESGREAKQILRDSRYARLDKLIDTRFKVGELLELLTLFEERMANERQRKVKDDELRKRITDNADVPTMFEYILGITWYVISGRKGDVLDYMKLSFDAELLPKSHAVGGDADIVYEYEASLHYPAHTLLLEVTLAEKNNQRRMEMEPVSRHLGDYLLANPEKEAYCIFSSGYLHQNVVSDFRSRKSFEYFNMDGRRFITGMKIIPMQVSEIKTILQKGITYDRLYGILDNAYLSELKVSEGWYGGIVNELQKSTICNE